MRTVEGRRARRGRALAFSCLVAAALFETPGALGAIVGGVSATLVPLSVPASGGTAVRGYTEYRVHLINHSEAVRTVVLTLPADPGPGRGDHIREIRRSVTLAPGTQTVVSLSQPPLPVSGGGGLRVTVGRAEAVLPVRLPDHGSYHGGLLSFHGRPRGPTIAILVSQSVDPRFRDALAKRTSGEPLVSPLPVSAWPTRWLSYSGYGAVLLTGTDMATMSADTREALLRYVECGGTVAVRGEWEPPRDIAVERGGVAAPRRRHGERTIYHGFGVLLIGENPVLEPHYEASAMPWKHRTAVEEANRAFPVVEDLRIPAKGFLLLMIVFAIVIGPVNVLVLHRKKRRIWLLWTVPAISLVASITLWVYSLAAEGWRGHERTECLTFLDQTLQSAATIGWTAFYTPLTPADGLRYGDRTELTPQWESDARGSRSRTLDWSDGQHLESGWIVPRVPAHFRVRRSDQPVRQRLKTTRRLDGTLEVVNGLGVDIEALFVADREGLLHSGARIPAGAQRALTPRGSRIRQERSLREVFESDWTRLVDTFRDHPERYLRVASYIAVVADTPFLEQGLANVSWRRARSAIYGILERDAP